MKKIMMILLMFSISSQAQEITTTEFVSGQPINASKLLEMANKINAILETEVVVAEEEISFVPSANNPNIVTANSYAKYRRFADRIIVDGYIEFASSNGNSAYILLPDSLTVDFTKIDNKIIVGRAVRGVAENGNSHFNLITHDANAAGVYFTRIASASSNPFTLVNNSDIYSLDEKISFHFEVPISGWSKTKKIKDLLP